MRNDLAPRAIVFDIGATLVTGPPIAPNKVIAGLLGNATPTEVASVIMTRPFRCADDVCSALCNAFGAFGDDVASDISSLWESQADAAEELDEASETILALKARGLKIGLLSDIWSPYYASVTKVIPNVIEAADAIVLSCETGRRKPSPHNFLTVLTGLGVGPEEAVMVGDTFEHDILPALNLGMRAVWVLARPDREIHSVIQVLNGRALSPTQVVWRIGEVASLDLMQQNNLETTSTPGA